MRRRDRAHKLSIIFNSYHIVKILSKAVFPCFMKKKKKVLKTFITCTCSVM